MICVLIRLGVPRAEFPSCPPQFRFCDLPKATPWLDLTLISIQELWLLWTNQPHDVGVDTLEVTWWSCFIGKSLNSGTLGDLLLFKQLSLSLPLSLIYIYAWFFWMYWKHLTFIIL